MPDGREVWTGWSTNWYGPDAEDDVESDAPPKEMPSAVDLGVDVDKNEHLKRYVKKDTKDSPTDLSQRSESGECLRAEGRWLWVVAQHQPSSDPVTLSTAEGIGKRLARHGFGLVFDGSRAGTMGIVFDGMQKAEGQTAAILIDDRPADPPLPKQTRIVHTDSPLGRRNTMIQMASGFLVLPGALSVVRDALDLILLLELGTHEHPIGLLNIDGFFDGVVKLADDLCDRGFIRDACRDRVFACENADELLNEMVWHIE